MTRPEKENYNEAQRQRNLKSICSLLSEPKITLASVVRKEQVHNITTNLSRKSSSTTRSKRKLIRQAAAIPSIALENLKKSIILMLQ